MVWPWIYSKSIIFLLAGIMRTTTIIRLIRATISLPTGCLFLNRRR